MYDGSMSSFGLTCNLSDFRVVFGREGVSGLAPRGC